MVKIISESKKTKARQLEITTPHGKILTPSFMPDATYGAIKSITFDEAKAAGVEEIVSTTLHLETNMDSSFVKNFGGLHEFYNWKRPIFTDSGGFQVFSLIHRSKNKHNKITDAGATFQDPKTGSFKILTPEISQMIQHKLDSDIRVVLDEPAIRNTSTKYLKEANRKTVEWAKRSKKKFLELNAITEKDFNNPKVKRPLLCAVVQGGNVMKLRRENAKELTEIGFDIYGFGGGIPMRDEKSWKVQTGAGIDPELIELLADLIPENAVRYGLGIGNPDDLDVSIKAGWDIFDTVLPTRNARHGYLYVEKGDGDQHMKNYSVLHIGRSEYKYDKNPVNKDSVFKEVRETSRSYLRYLFKIREVSAQRIATLNNLEFYTKFVKSIYAKA